MATSKNNTYLVQSNEWLTVPNFGTVLSFFRKRLLGIRVEIVFGVGEKKVLRLTPRDAVGLVQAFLELLHVIGREKGGTARHELPYLPEGRRRQQ